ncbi:MAG: sporulation initiation inhibitor protein Soj [Armatimonadota bacterium]|nr:MAG: sporulation initiation inhibitor protein Soj [Armatimonadota bacterium]
MGVLYAVVNQKGGVGKTTTAVNVAAAIALANRRVLLVDVDPQGNATSGVGIEKSKLPSSIYHVLVDDLPIEEVVMGTSIQGLDIVPSTLDLAGAEIELMTRISREQVLKHALEPLRKKYDYIFIDTPPSLGLLTINCLTACDKAIVPIQCEYYALEGISQLMRTVDLVRRRLNPVLRIAHVLLTMKDPRLRLAQQVEEEVRNYFGDIVSPVVIPRNVRLSEAPSFGLPVVIYDPKSRGAEAYRQFALEVMQDDAQRTG